MSFSKEVKKELYDQVGKSRHCQLAELAAYFAYCGRVILEDRGNYIIKFSTESLTVCKKCSILVKKVFKINPEVTVRGKHQFFLYILEEEKVAEFLDRMYAFNNYLLVEDKLIEKLCCKRAFLRGIFLVNGTLNDPKQGGYHLEMIGGSYDNSLKIQKIIREFNLNAKISERKKNHIVYIKDGSSIADFLNIIGAHRALMEFENIRILKDMRNSINRRVNFETANIQKSASAASKQVEDIEYIYNTIGFGKLDKGLCEIAKARLDHPDMTLKELGEMLEHPIGKSGVNHRLRKLAIIARDLRKERE